MADSVTTEPGEFRRYWTLILASMVGMGFGTISTASAGLFMGPLSEEFGWSRALLSSGLSITSVAVFFLSPIGGIAIDRWGTRRLALIGIALTSLVIASLSLLNGDPLMWMAIWSVYAFTGVLVKSTTWSAAVSSVFEKGRGLALGLTLSGSAIAQAVVPVITHYLIEAWGWRGAYAILGLGGGLIALAICGLYLFDGYDISRRQREKEGASERKGPLLDVPGLSVSQAFRSIALWQIAISTFLMMVITIALNVHQFEILRGVGVDRGAAAWYTGITGIAGIAGKLITGWLLDRFHARWVGGWTLGITAIAFIILMLPGLTAPLIVLAMIINGYAAGTKLQIASYLTSAYGGMRNFGTIYGIIASLIAAGSGAGPLVAGFIYDAYGNYDPFLIFGISGTLVSSALIFLLGPYPRFEERKDEVFA